MERIVIIGATSGIGRGLAEHFAREGALVGLAGRRAELLEEVAARMPGRFRTAVADVTARDVATRLDALVASLGGMDICIVSAGAGELNPELDFGSEEPAIRTNVVGWTCVVDWAYRCFERQRTGHLVVITSVGGLRGNRIAPAYNASKAYQMNYAEGLRQKAAKAGLPIAVTDIRPGLADTAMAKGEGLFWVMPVDKVVRQIGRAIRRRRPVAVVTRRWRLAAWLLRHLPERIYRKL